MKLIGKLTHVQKELLLMQFTSEFITIDDAFGLVVSTKKEEYFVEIHDENSFNVYSLVYAEPKEKAIGPPCGKNLFNVKDFFEEVEAYENSWSCVYAHWLLDSTAFFCCKKAFM